MILSTQISLGQRVKMRVDWEEAVLTGQVIYLHPEQRYFTVRFDSGVRESFCMADPARLARRGTGRAAPVKYNQYNPEGPDKPDKPKGATETVRRALTEAGVKATDVSRAMGYNKAWLAIRMQRGVPEGMVDGLLRTIQALAKQKSSP